MRIGGEPAAADLAAEALELVLAEPPLEEGPRVDAGRGVALEEEHVRSLGVVRSAEEVLEAHLHHRRGGGVAREVTANALVGFVGAGHHGHGVPANDPLHPSLEGSVSGIRYAGCVVSHDRVAAEGRHDPEGHGPRDDPAHDPLGGRGTELVVQRLQRLEPLADARSLFLTLLERSGGVAHERPLRRTDSAIPRRIRAGARASSIEMAEPRLIPMS